MRKLIYLVASTIDGYIAGPDRSDPSGTIFELTGDHSEPLMNEYPEMIPHHVRKMLGVDGVEPRRFDTVLEGRGSYEKGLDIGITNAYPHLRHLVFSSTLGAIDDPGVELVASNALERVRALKAEPGRDIWLCGGGSLAGALHEEVDEIHLKLNPVIIGTGVPLFDLPAGSGPVLDRFRLRSARTFDSGVALLIYTRR